MFALPYGAKVAGDKQNRIPAANMSFHQPNLPALIAEIETLLAQR